MSDLLQKRKQSTSKHEFDSFSISNLCDQLKKVVVGENNSKYAKKNSKDHDHEFDQWQIFNEMYSQNLSGLKKRKEKSRKFKYNISVETRPESLNTQIAQKIQKGHSSLQQNPLQTRLGQYQSYSLLVGREQSRLDQGNLQDSYLDAKLSSQISEIMSCLIYDLFMINIESDQQEESVLVRLSLYESSIEQITDNEQSSHSFQEFKQLNSQEISDGCILKDVYVEYNDQIN